MIGRAAVQCAKDILWILSMGATVAIETVWPSSPDLSRNVDRILRERGADLADQAGRAMEQISKPDRGNDPFWKWCYEHQDFAGHCGCPDAVGRMECEGPDGTQTSPTPPGGSSSTSGDFPPPVVGEHQAAPADRSPAGSCPAGVSDGLQAPSPSAGSLAGRPMSKLLTDAARGLEALTSWPQSQTDIYTYDDLIRELRYRAGICRDVEAQQITGPVETGLDMGARMHHEACATFPQHTKHNP